MISAAICMSLRWFWQVSVICHVFNHCFGSFLLQDMFFNSPSICFWGTRYDVYCERVAYLHSILWRRSHLWSVGFLSRVSYLPSYVFLRRHRSFTSGKLCFLQLSDRAYVSGVWCIGLFFLRSFWYQRIHEDSHLLIVLRVSRKNKSQVSCYTSFSDWLI